MVIAKIISNGLKNNQKFQYIITKVRLKLKVSVFIKVPFQILIHHLKFILLSIEIVGMT